MGQGTRRGAGMSFALLAVAVSVGLGVLIPLLPAGGVDTDPPQCFSTFGYTVLRQWPCLRLRRRGGGCPSDSLS